MDSQPTLENPLITPRQMNFLRAVAALAWADGVLEPQEVVTLTEQLVPLFRHNEAIQAQIATFLTQNIPLIETLPRLTDPQERALLLKLAYIVIHVSRRHPNEPLVNLEETRAYQRLREQINLSPELITQIETEASTQLNLDGYVTEVAELFAP
jgi:hypothetical protein